MAKYLNDTGTIYVISKIKELLAGKVDKVDGKGLSTNDYTTAEKTKLSGIATNANNYTLPIAGTALGGVKEGGDIEIDSNGQMTVPGLTSKAPLASPTFTGAPKAPTASAGNNTTQIATTAFVSTAVANAVSGITSFKFEVVSQLPSTGEAGTIYLVSNGGSGQNIYDEYIWVNNKFEKIGTTAVDLSNYWSKTELVAITTGEIDAMFE